MEQATNIVRATTGQETPLSNRAMSSEALRLRVFAAALTLLSGAVMMLAGYIGHTAGWTAVGLIAIPGGIVISTASALARRADRANSHTVAPSRGHRGGRVAATAVTLVSGGVMVLAGYAGSAWGWGLAAPLAAVGGLVIGARSRFSSAAASPRRRN